MRRDRPYTERLTASSPAILIRANFLFLTIIMVASGLSAAFYDYHKLNAVNALLTVTGGLLTHMAKCLQQLLRLQGGCGSVNTKDALQRRHRLVGEWTDALASRTGKRAQMSVKTRRVVDKNIELQ